MNNTSHLGAPGPHLRPLNAAVTRRFCAVRQPSPEPTDLSGGPSSAADRALASAVLTVAQPRGLMSIDAARALALRVLSLGGQLFGLFDSESERIPGTLIAFDVSSTASRPHPWDVNRTTALLKGLREAGVFAAPAGVMLALGRGVITRVGPTGSAAECIASWARAIEPGRLFMTRHAAELWARLGPSLEMPVIVD